jgi:hypothetical protein
MVMRRRLLGTAGALGAALALTVAATAGNGTPINPASANTLTLSVIGDVPYSEAQFAAFPAWVDAINRAPKVDLVVHLGDIKSGGTRCDDDYYAAIFGFFMSLKDPLVYTPGDNEWTDCHRPSNGPYDPLERLSRLRQVFFAHPGVTLGGRQKQIVTQPGYPENALWMESKAVFAAIHVVGSNNSLAPWTGLTAPTAAQLAEAEARKAAAISWIDEAFDTAEENPARGVVLMMQADTFAGTNETAAGFASILARIEERAMTFGGPVLLLQGDTHVYLEDEPFAAAPNVRRIVVEGAETGDEWLELTVDPRTTELFSWKRIPF